MLDAETLWVNIANAVLGIAVVAVFLAISSAAIYDVVVKLRRRRARSAEMDRDMRRLGKPADWTVPKRRSVAAGR
jgi:hypothetical protein